LWWWRRRWRRWWRRRWGGWWRKEMEELVVEEEMEVEEMEVLGEEVVGEEMEERKEMEEVVAKEEVVVEEVGKIRWRNQIPDHEKREGAREKGKQFCQLKPLFQLQKAAFFFVIPLVISADIRAQKMGGGVVGER
jgi:hypothetical protein